MPMPLDLQPHIDRYLRHLADDLHRSPSTVTGSREELGLLVKRGIALAHDALAAHLTRLPDGRPVAPTTRNRRLAILRGFVRFLCEYGELDEDPLAGVRRATLTRRARLAVSADELQLVLDALRDEPRRWLRARDATIVLLLYYTGLRLSELARLDVGQVDLGAGVLRAVLRKGGDHTDVVLHPRLAAQLAAWLHVRGQVASAAVFPRGDAGRVQMRAIQLRLRQMGERAGLRAPLHPHALRHAHATGLLRVGVSTAMIQMSLNHKSLATTELYLHSDVALLKAAVGNLPNLHLPS